MKHKIKLVSIASMGLITSLGLGTVFGQTIEMATRQEVVYNDLLTRNLSPNNFVSQPLQNNTISNQGNTVYQYQDLISTQELNDVNGYNGNNVLSTQSILTVRSENFYFNFIKSNLNNTYNIISTPVDPTSPIGFQTYRKLGITLLNGSAIWLNNRLIIGGQVGTGGFDLVALSLDELTGKLTEEARLKTSTSVNQELFKLSNATEKNNSPPPDAIGNETYIPKKVASFPVYLSPITNYDNPSSTNSQILAWSSGIALGGREGLASGNNASKSLVIINYDHDSGFTMDSRRNFPAIISNGGLLAIPTPLTSVEEMNATIVTSITPIKHENGNLELYVYSIGIGVVPIPDSPPSPNIFVTRVTVSPTQYEVKEFLPHGIESTNGKSGFENFSTSNFGRDLTAVIPNALVGRGDEINPTETSSTINLFWIGSFNTMYASQGLLANVILDTSKGFDGKILSSPPERNLFLYEPFGYIYTNYTDLAQMHYGIGGNLEDGIYIGIKYYGISAYRTQTRVGYIKWQQPWNPNFWSQDALFYGTEIIKGNNANSDANAPSTKDMTSHIMPTISNGIMSTTGIYENQINGAIKPYTSPIMTNTRNIIDNKNTYNTSVPKNITLKKGDELNPIILENEKIIEIIKSHSIDYPRDFSRLILDNTVFSSNPDSEKNSLKIDFYIENPYVNGEQKIDNDIKSFSTLFQNSPNQEEINNPIMTNNSSKKQEVPSNSSPALNQAFSNGYFIPSSGIIGTSSSDLIQIPSRISPFITNLESFPDDFLGTMKINYVLTPATLGSSPISGSLTINGFFGMVYIIPIVLGSIILIGGIIGLIFLLLRRKHANALKSSISSGFKLYETRKLSNKTNISSKRNSEPGKPINKQPSNPNVGEPGKPINKQPSNPNVGEQGKAINKQPSNPNVGEQGKPINKPPNPPIGLRR